MWNWCHSRVPIFWVLGKGAMRSCGSVWHALGASRARAQQAREQSSRGVQGRAKRNGGREERASDRAESRESAARTAAREQHRESGASAARRGAIVGFLWI